MQYETHHCFLLCFFFSQEREAVRSAAVWVIVSPIVPSWRPCRPSRLPTSAAGTVWPTAPWTSKALDFLTLWRGSDEIFLRVVLEWREVLVGRKKKHLAKDPGIANQLNIYSCAVLFCLLNRDYDWVCKNVHIKCLSCHTLYITVPVLLLQLPSSCGLLEHFKLLWLTQTF